MATFVDVRKAATAPVIHSRNARRAIALLAFVALTAFGAHVAFPLPGTMVPVTLQTLFVTLAGALLGPYLGAASMVLYLALGAAGAPVFAMGAGFAYLFGPTGGYLLSYPLAAAVTGMLCGTPEGGARGFARIAFASAVGSIVILALGWAQLTLLGGDAASAFRLGVAPFILGDIVKIALCAAIALRLRKRTLGLL
jgi:biotin transport system substrate-specific component